LEDGAGMWAGRSEAASRNSIDLNEFIASTDAKENRQATVFAAVFCNR